jgi:hypothetical protein
MKYYLQDFLPNRVGRTNFICSTQTNSHQFDFRQISTYDAKKKNALSGPPAFRKWHL